MNFDITFYLYFLSLCVWWHTDELLLWAALCGTVDAWRTEGQVFLMFRLRFWISTSFRFLLLTVRPGRLTPQHWHELTIKCNKYFVLWEATYNPIPCVHPGVFLIIWNISFHKITHFPPRFPSSLRRSELRTLGLVVWIRRENEPISRSLKEKSLLLNSFWVHVFLLTFSILSFNSRVRQ